MAIFIHNFYWGFFKSIVIVSGSECFYKLRKKKISWRLGSFSKNGFTSVNVSIKYNYDTVILSFLRCEREFADHSSYSRLSFYGHKWSKTLRECEWNRCEERWTPRNIRTIKELRLGANSGKSSRYRLCNKKIKKKSLRENFKKTFDTLIRPQTSKKYE